MLDYSQVGHQAGQGHAPAIKPEEPPAISLQEACLVCTVYPYRWKRQSEPFKQIETLNIAFLWSSKTRMIISLQRFLFLMRSLRIYDGMKPPSIQTGWDLYCSWKVPISLLTLICICPENASDIIYIEGQIYLGYIAFLITCNSSIDNQLLKRNTRNPVSIANGPFCEILI